MIESKRIHTAFIKCILIPVDLELSTEFVVKQAIELAFSIGATIHLLHVIKTPDNGSNHFLNRNEVLKSKDGIEIKQLEKLLQWKESIEATVAGCNVSIHLMEGIIQNSIIEAAIKLKPQLIILGMNKKNSLFSYFLPICPNEISKLAHCPVLAIFNNASTNSMQEIVVPVRSFVPEKKIELILIFTKMYRAKIHLLALKDKPGENDAERTALLDTYRILKNRLSGQVEFHVIPSANLARATLKYAEKIGADMIFLNPCTETKISSFSGKHINELVPATSKLKFLFVEPAL